MRIEILTMLVILAAGPAAAYDVQLDIDTDGSPYTINDYSAVSPAQLRIVLIPSEPGEWISGIAFGLGGTCWECLEWGAPYTYGTDCDLFAGFGAWHDSPLIEASWSDISLCLGCCNGNGAGEGYHYFFEALAADGGFALSEPVFIAEFEAWVSDSHVFDRCPHPPSDLITFPLGGQESAGNMVRITDQFTPTAKGSFSAVKSLY